MAKLFGELLFTLLRILIADLLATAAVKFCAWLDTKVHGRITRIVLGVLLGLGAFFLYPIILGLF